MKPENMGWQHWQNLECQRLGITLIQHDQIVKVCRKALLNGAPDPYDAICALVLQGRTISAEDIEVIQAQLKGEQDDGEEG